MRRASLPLSVTHKLRCEHYRRICEGDIRKHKQASCGDSEALIAASQIVSMMSNPSVGLLIETNDRYTINPDVELN